MVSVKEKFVAGVFYMALAKYSNIVIQLVITAILARLLTPEDFGAVAISTVLITFFQLLSDAGFSPAIIQNKNLEKKDLDSIFSTCFYIGLIVALMIFALATYISDFYSINVLENIFKLLSVCCLFTCLNIVPESLLKRNKKFRFIATRTIFINLCCGCIAVVTAYYGLGVYSLLITPICSSIVVFVVNYYQNPLKIMPPLQCKVGLYKVINYSIYQFLYNIVNYFSRNLDKLVVGKVLGSSLLGFYEKSYHLMMVPVANLSNVVAPAIQPFFSDKQNDTQWMFCNSCKILHFLALFSFPLSVFCFFAAEEIILIFFGEQWEAAVMPFKILSLSVGFQVIYSPQGAFYQAANSTKKLFTSGLFVALLNVVAIIVGVIITRSLDILCYGVVLTYIVSFFYVYYILVVRLYRKRFVDFILEFKKPFIIALILALVMLVLGEYMNVHNLVFSFVLKILVFAIAYIILILLLKEKQFFYLLYKK